MRTIAEMLRWRARRHPCARGRSGSKASRRPSPSSIESSSQLAAGFVDELGLRPGDRVGVLDKNCAAYFELFFALDKAGVVAAPLNWRLTPHEVKAIIDDVKPKLIVTGAEFKAHGAASGVPTMTFDDLPRGGEDPRRDVDGAVSRSILHLGHHRPSERRNADRLEPAQRRVLAGRSKTPRCAKAAVRWFACRYSISAARSGRSGRCRPDRPS